MSAESLVKTSQSATNIAGIHTDVVVTEFEDKLFIVVSQFNKLGTLVLVTKDIALEETANATFSTRVLLGKDEAMTHVFSRSLAGKIPGKKPLLLAMAFRNRTPGTLKAAEEFILKQEAFKTKR